MSLKCIIYDTWSWWSSPFGRYLVHCKASTHTCKHKNLDRTERILFVWRSCFCGTHLVKSQFINNAYVREKYIFIKHLWLWGRSWPSGTFTSSNLALNEKCLDIKIIFLYKYLHYIIHCKTFTMRTATLFQTHSHNTPLGHVSTSLLFELVSSKARLPNTPQLLSLLILSGVSWALHGHRQAHQNNEELNWSQICVLRVGCAVSQKNPT